MRTGVLLPGLAPENRLPKHAKLTVYVDRDIVSILKLIAIENESNVSRVTEEIIKEFLAIKHREETASHNGN